MSHKAIYNLYPNVVSIDDTAGAMDKDGNPVPIVQSNYEEEVARLQAEQRSIRQQTDTPLVDHVCIVLRLVRLAIRLQQFRLLIRLVVAMRCSIL